MARLGIFQFYSDFGLVEDYVLFILNSMGTILSKLIIVYNGYLEDTELQKLNQYTDNIYQRKIIGYDASSYKDVFLFLYQEDWSQWDEVILFNNTFYGPFYDWKQVINRMNKEDVDFEGLSKHLGKIRLQKDRSLISEHLQAYFLVIRKKWFRVRSSGNFGRS